MYKTETKAHCLQCGKTITGRNDKKFCGIGCKNAYHNMEVEKRRTYMKKVDDKMHVNYLILDESLRSGCTSLKLEELCGFGFRPELATSCRKRHKGLEFGCYDILYSQSDSKIFNIHRIGLAELDLQ